MDKYCIMIIGDNILEGEIELTEMEIATLYKVLMCLKADGPYAPSVDITNLSECDRRRKAEAELQRKAAEQAQRDFEEKCSHIGKFKIGDKYPDLAAMFA